LFGIPKNNLIWPIPKKLFCLYWTCTPLCGFVLFSFYNKHIRTKTIHMQLLHFLVFWFLTRMWVCNRLIHYHLLYFFIEIIGAPKSELLIFFKIICSSIKLLVREFHKWLHHNLKPVWYIICNVFINRLNYTYRNIIFSFQLNVIRIFDSGVYLF
jgi:hypothetical protein